VPDSAGVTTVSPLPDGAVAGASRFDPTAAANWAVEKGSGWRPEADHECLSAVALRRRSERSAHVR
jgi:hypothetical protein